ncbi:MAG: ChaN family lipoprotein [Deltaproteobacteria bacterium]|nr:ChaN family lipoprotein [Deltaproteobacteria bacterium]
MSRFSPTALALAVILIAIPAYRVFAPAKVPDRLLRLPARTTAPVAEVASELRRVSLVFMGEGHDRHSHHLAQLTMIRALHGQTSRLAIGLEMVQARHQAELDRWVSGEGSETEIRKAFERDWRFPWSLYRDIFHFARERRVPLVGLNVDEEIPRQVAKRGFASLTPAERGQIPPVTCNVDGAYEALIRRAHGAHAHGGSSFRHFCEAQRVWDASMAWHLVQFLKTRPTYQVVVLAGSGHSWKHGIPDEVSRLGAFERSVILLEDAVTAGSVTAEDADYFWPGLG